VIDYEAERRSRAAIHPSCVCVCVCKRERERERKREREREIKVGISLLQFTVFEY